MNPGPPEPTPERSWWKRWVAAWNQFWFAPSDPTTLALIRLLTGVVTVYTFFAYSMDRQAILGPSAWMDLETRLEMVREEPIISESLRWVPAYEAAPRPTDPKQKAIYEKYEAIFKEGPPLPYPRTAEEGDDIIAYRLKWTFDPRLAYTKGHSVWSLWFHVTDPTQMAVAQWTMVAISVLFMIGLCTRLTSVLTWLAALSYIHRAPASLFGVDTMMVILLLYLSIGPSGATLSVDRWISRWWSRSRGDIIRRWRRLWGKSGGEIAFAAVPDEPAPSVSATVAIRLLQIHLCIIYLAAGLSKFQGQTWWTGYAVWGTMANFEFAPMQQAWYVEMMRLLGGNRVVFEVFFTCAAIFTLVFEISYAFLIWRPWSRPILLGMAFLLHGFIGMFMGLRTFSLLMVVLNLAFVSPETVRHWLRLRGKPTPEPTPATHERHEPAVAGPADKRASRHVIAGRGKRKEPRT